MSECSHRPGGHPKPFWFVDVLDEHDDGYNPGRTMWKVFLQVDGMVCPISSPLFLSEIDGLNFIRSDILPATTVCDD